MIEIDGSKDPAAVPQWLVWSTAFRVIGNLPDGKRPALAIPASEVETIFNAAKNAVDADVKCNKDLTAELAILKLRGKKPLDVYRANQKLVIACRQDQLDMADKLMDSIAPGSRSALIGFVDDRRRGIQRTVPEKELKFFRSPR